MPGGAILLYEPTAMHADGQQETPDRPAPAGREIVWAVQVVPFQVIGWPPLNATQLPALAHDKPDTLPTGLGGGLTCVHPVPSQV